MMTVGQARGAMELGGLDVLLVLCSSMPFKHIIPAALDLP